LGQNGSAHYW